MPAHGSVELRPLLFLNLYQIPGSCSAAQGSVRELPGTATGCDRGTSGTSSALSPHRSCSISSSSLFHPLIISVPFPHQPLFHPLISPVPSSHRSRSIPSSSLFHPLITPCSIPSSVLFHLPIAPVPSPHRSRFHLPIAPVPSPHRSSFTPPTAHSQGSPQPE